jgi:hypothetical protein
MPATLSRRGFLGWASFTGYAAWTLLRPPWAHAGPKVKVMAGVAVASGAALGATVTTTPSGDLYSLSY